MERTSLIQLTFSENHVDANQYFLHSRKLFQGVGNLNMKTRDLAPKAKVYTSLPPSPCTTGVGWGGWHVSGELACQLGGGWHVSGVGLTLVLTWLMARGWHLWGRGKSKGLVACETTGAPNTQKK